MHVARDEGCDRERGWLTMGEGGSKGTKFQLKYKYVSGDIMYSIMTTVSNIVLCT